MNEYDQYLRDEEEMQEGTLEEGNNPMEKLFEIENFGFDCFQNILGSSNTTVKAFSNDIKPNLLKTFKNSIGANILVIEDETSLEMVEKTCRDILSKTKGYSFNIVYIKESMLEIIEDKVKVKLDTQDVLTEKEINNGTSSILAG